MQGPWDVEELPTRSEKEPIIIDDGSHRSSDIIFAFLSLFSHLEDGGVYIVEDLACSYWQEYEGGVYYNKSAISFFKLLVDYCNRDFWGIDADPVEIFHIFGFDVGQYSGVLDHVHSVEFLNSMCIIRKDAEVNNRLGRRVVAGQEFEVEDTRALNGGYLSVPSQIENPYARLPKSGISMMSDLVASEVRVYWTEKNEGYVENRSRGVDYIIDGEQKKLSIEIFVEEGVGRLRLDPTDVPCFIMVHSISLLSDGDHPIWQWSGRLDSVETLRGIFCWSVNGAMGLVCWDDDPELELRAVIKENYRGIIKLVLDFTPYPLLEKLPWVLDEILGHDAGSLVSSSVKAALPVGFSKHLSDLAGLLKAKLEQKNGVIASQQHEIQLIQKNQQLLYEQLVRAEAQLDLLKQWVFSDGHQLERL